MTNLKGVLLKSIGGFYYVEAAEKVYECKARGIFRKKGNSPFAGDIVQISIPENGFASIEKIEKRKNYIVRPPIANIDLLIIVCSTIDPLPNTLVIDKMTAIAANKGIEPVIVISKTDIQSNDEIVNIYKNAGIKTIMYSSVDKSGTDEILNLLNEKTTAFIGNSGVGKSTLLNTLFPNLNLETGDISQKLGRGKHTTRSVELFKVNGGYVADTPGFSTVDLERYEIIEKDKLQYCFSEFEQYINQCRFSSCAHLCEKDCAVIKAVSDGKIQKSRHDSYVSMYNEVKDIKPWNTNQKSKQNS